jgi:hypothetical protein
MAFLVIAMSHGRFTELPECVDDNHPYPNENRSDGLNQKMTLICLLLWSKLAL